MTVLKNNYGSALFLTFYTLTVESPCRIRLIKPNKLMYFTVHIGFSTHGLGGVLTCGVVGIKAGLSHSPVSGGKEQYGE